MDIEILNTNCIKRDYKNRLKFKINNSSIFLNEELLELDIKYNLSPFYKERLVDLCKSNDITEKESLTFLLDYYYLDSAATMKLLSKQLRDRLNKGVNKPFIIYLRNLYTVIGHFLKKLRYI